MERQVIIVADLGYGDAGKGSVVDYLTRTHHAATVVRYNGGPQAGHRVVTSDGQDHVFSSFGSGMFVPDVETHISAFCLVNPLNLITEGAALSNKGVSGVFGRTTVHRDSVIITPWHRAGGRLRELMRDELNYARHGSCGEGIGEARFAMLEGVELCLRAGHLPSTAQVEKILTAHKARYQAEFHFLRRSENPTIKAELAVLDDTDPADVADVYTRFTNMVRIVDDDYLAHRLAIAPAVFEGAQGVLLDEGWGFYPHVTWTDTSFDNALQILADVDYEDRVVHIGVLRAYTTRHGAGPLVTEDPKMTEALPDQENVLNPWQHNFRVGAFDLPAHRYAAEVAGHPDAIALTCMDRLVHLGSWRSCTAYRVPPQVAAFFDVDAGYTRRIRVAGQRGDLDYQAELATAMSLVEPRYRFWSTRDGADYMDWVGEELRSPVAIASFGPRAEDKVLRPSVSI